MHYEFALESYKHHVNNEWDTSFENSELHFLKFIAPQEEVLKLAESYNNERIKSICASMRQTDAYKRVTDKQRYAIAKFLLEQNNNSAKAILIKIYPQLEGAL